MSEASASELKKALEGLHGCKAHPLRVVQVHEDVEGKLIFEGVVHVACQGCRAFHAHLLPHVCRQSR